MADASMLWVALSIAAVAARLDVWPPAVLLTYGPHAAYAALAISIASVRFARRRWVRGAAAVLTAAAALAALEWGAGARSEAASRTVTLVAMNVHDSVRVGYALAELCEERGVDVLVLQEIRRATRRAFVEALPEFEFHGDASGGEDPEGAVLTNLTGVRRGASVAVEEYETGLTGYRTAAAALAVDGRRVWVVNVHTTKAFVLSYGPASFVRNLGRKAARHQRESHLLSAWIRSRAPAPVVAAGDFNAPAGSESLRILELESAHATAGSGPHLTYPAALPVVGIDHVLGDAGVEFHDHRTFALPGSDHLGQLVEFSLRER